MIFRRTIATALLATLSLTALPSFAQNNGKDSKHNKNTKVIVIKQEQSDRRDDRKDDKRAERRDDQRSNQRAPGYYYNARGAEFQRGHRLPSTLRSKQYVVANPHHHKLKTPPRGQQWVQVGSDYVLVAITTGLIASIVLGR